MKVKICRDVCVVCVKAIKDHEESADVIPFISRRGSQRDFSFGSRIYGCDLDPAAKQAFL